ncbi:membrane protein [Xanthomonas sp. NCPPB 1128]|uniref:multidrug/biocide efflux PACE transporter n=1 Tax=Xanthomonas sp. NCPPB 1128 TaxID=1775876 RepID=UPI00065AE875|nr:multidrug/biocide efflux PACE transporter [Xanthomonas sp. NCPPB 1128]KMM74784.1 membrane protein [Xanthomonas sp. NCPPB 1128]
MSSQLTQRPASARLLHAVLFEGCAVLLSAPTLAWLLDRSLAHMGLLAAVFSAIAMLWNLVFNLGFDHLQRRLGFVRGIGVRLLHALGFEAGLIVVLVPLAAWWLSIGLWQALLLDLGLILFFLPYTLAFNWLYDLGYAAWLRRTNATCRAQC